MCVNQTTPKMWALLGFPLTRSCWARTSVLEHAVKRRLPTEERKWRFALSHAFYRGTHRSGEVQGVVMPKHEDHISIESLAPCLMVV